MTTIGERVVDGIFRFMLIDDEWSVRKPGEFTWWAGPLAQRVWCDQPVEDSGTTIHRIHARTDLVCGYEGTEEQLAILGEQARVATMSGAVRDEHDPTKIQLACNMNLHRETESWGIYVMAIACVLQLAEADVAATTLSDRMDFGFKVARSSHPDSGPREEPNEVHLFEGDVAPYAEDPSEWAGREIMDLVELYQNPPCVLANGSESDLVAEFPFGAQTSLLRVATSEANLLVGNGCSISLALPVADADTPKSRWLEFNEREAFGFAQPHLLGSWCPGKHGLTFVSFLPNTLYRPGALKNLVMAAAVRAQWVPQELYGLSFDGDFAAAGARKRAEMEAFLTALKAKK